MLTRVIPALLVCLMMQSLNAAEFQSLFNGKDLSGWKGQADLWTVKDGAIVGDTFKTKINGNTFLIWQGGNVKDFILKARIRVEGKNNSGIQYRSRIVDDKKFVVGGYQCDIHPSQAFFGMMYGEKTGRGIIAKRWQKIEVGKDGKPKQTGEVGNKAELKIGEWNEFTIIAVGNRLIHQVNGVTTIDLTDNHKDAASEGVIAIQCHAGGPMRAFAKDIQLKKLAASEGKAAIDAAIAASAKAAAAKPAAKKTAAKPKALKPAGEWIWSKPLNRAGPNDVVFFRKSFTVSGKPKAAHLIATCDNAMTVCINGKVVASSSAWESWSQEDITKHIVEGKNVIAIHGMNEGGTAAGLIANVALTAANGSTQVITTDKSWKIADPKSVQKGAKWRSTDYDDSSWKTAIVQAKWGGGPWGARVHSGGAGSALAAVPQGVINLPDGFKIEKIYSVNKATQGSWVGLTVGPKGRLYASDQGGKGLYRITPSKAGDGEEGTKVEKVNVDVSNAQGMVWAFGSLYINRNGGGVWRITDTNNDDQLDKAEQIMNLAGGGEHGPHGIILTEDGKGLYVVGGNHTAIPTDLTGSRIPQTWSEDLLLPRQWDARGHARGKLAPGGWVARISPDGKQRELYSIGYRNEYDIALNHYGDMFTFDSDMEWDFGSPWYRPTRVCHVASGSEFGWRSGTGKWPAYYPDSLPATVDIGPASPTGVVFGYGSKFPAKWQNAFYILDWTYGTIWAIHNEVVGSGYVGKVEEFVSGSPLPVTDAIIGHDGAFYFAVGGRGTGSALYRVTYAGDDSTEAVKPGPVPAAIATRRALEEFHGKQSPKAVAAALQHIGSEDRFLRYAARIALEAQPLKQWRDKVLSLTDAQGLITGAVAVARTGTESDLSDTLNALNGLNLASLSESQLLEALRAYQLAFIRLGKPSAEVGKAIASRLDAMYPSESRNVNRELVQLLVYLDSPTVVEKTIKLIKELPDEPAPEWATVLGRNSRYGGGAARMIANMPPTQGIAYAFALRNVRYGWSLDQRKTFFQFINDAAKKPGGNSYAGFLGNIRKEALANCSEAERRALAKLTGEKLTPPPSIKVVPPKGPAQVWTTDSALAAVNEVGLKGRDFANGKNAFHAVACVACHRFDGEGGGIGPDLTSVSGKYTTRDLLESIIEPSKVISDQYGSAIVSLKNGKTLQGIVIDNDGNNPNADVMIYTADHQAKPNVVNKKDIASIKESPVSQMPPGLVNLLNKEELANLVAFLMSRGNPNSPLFK